MNDSAFVGRQIHSDFAHTGQLSQSRFNAWIAAAELSWPASMTIFQSVGSKPAWIPTIGAEYPSLSMSDSVVIGNVKESF